MIKNNNINDMIKTFNEVIINSDEDFLKIKETLTRVGVPNIKDNILNQSCHILHKKGKYYIVHFKELYMLDGKKVNMSDEDYIRRDKICELLKNWGLVKTVNKHLKYLNNPEGCYFYVVKYKEKHKWDLRAKYNIGIIKK